MKLYGFTASPNTWKVRALAAHLKQPLDYEFVDLLKGEQRTPAYLALNPTGRTPTLVDGAATLWESNAIMQYVASQTETPLWPSDAKSRADISRWQCWQLAHWDAQACGPLIFENLIKKFANLGTAEQTAVAKATEAFNKEAQMLDGHLAKHKYLVNDTLTLADFAVAAPLFHAQSAGMPIAPHANLRTWFERVSSLPCWNETAPQMPAAA
ncbi:MAG TPA: glutathione S-transferase family protein [Xanthobacteraceae bacterium]|jgi:glutathione S-transferase|nr:glutathione S-transferase family protein [Xanthobacteraceae bacterium]